jgi:hypothetical protein
MNETREKLKGVAFNGSARKDGNTAILVNTVFRESKKQGSIPNLSSLQGKRSGVVLPAENAMRIRINAVLLPTISSTSASKRCLKLMGSSWHHPPASRMFQRR